MYKLKVQAHFSAAHNLRGYQGKCEKLHGHNWKVQVEIGSQRLNNLGMVCDFREIKQKLGKVIKKLDHSYLNEIKYFKQNNPTSEKIAEYIYTNLKKLITSKHLNLNKISVWETETARAEFSDEIN